ncbi:MAG: hypothetical protein E6J29_04405 [Chloroflexi bacterium]|nr:MAG: hypothetical protein E6J29_04405 [Chloroflexota bacterium]TMD56372.1 MAG: hypothetical protein E6I85_00610 [Chloroflexota bacterium]
MREVNATPAVVLGVLSMFLALLGPFALRAGLRSLRQINAHPGVLTGTGSALFGIIAGAASTVFLVAGLAWFVAVGVF